MREMHEENSRLGWLFTTIIVCIFLAGGYWCMQLESYDEKDSRKACLERIAADKAIYRMQATLTQRRRAADALGEEYTLGKLFADKRDIFVGIRKFNRRFSQYDYGPGESCNMYANRTISDLQNLYFRYHNDHGRPLSEYDRRWAKFEHWKRQYAANDQPVFRGLPRGWPSKLGLWLWIFLARSFLFVPPIYILRMLRRGGAGEVRSVIKANPVRFVLASFLWMFGDIAKYPYDILWEWWLEIQIRRLGNSARRRLTREEIRLIRTMDRNQYRSWKRGQRFRRNVAAAACGLILFVLASSVFASPGTTTSFGKAPPGLSQCHDSGMELLNWEIGSPVLLVEAPAIEPPETSSRLVHTIVTVPSKRADEIAHVPNFGRMGCLTS